MVGGVNSRHPQSPLSTKMRQTTGSYLFSLLEPYTMHNNPNNNDYNKFPVSRKQIESTLADETSVACAVVPSITYFYSHTIIIERSSIIQIQKRITPHY